MNSWHKTQSYCGDWFVPQDGNTFVLPEVVSKLGAHIMKAAGLDDKLSGMSGPWRGSGRVWSIHHASDVFSSLGNILDYKWWEGNCYLVDWNTCLVVSTGVQVVFQVQMFKGINLSEFATPLCQFTFKRIQHQKDAYLQLHCFSELESFYWLPDDMIRHAPSIQHTFIYFWISQDMYHNHYLLTYFSCWYPSEWQCISTSHRILLGMNQTPWCSPPLKECGSEECSVGRSETACRCPSHCPIEIAESNRQLQG